LALTSTPQSLFVVQAMLIRQLLFLGFYRLNALVNGGAFCRPVEAALFAAVTYLNSLLQRQR
jgi:hypothetical protein